MLMASRAHSPAGRSSRPASRAGTFSTFPWQDGLSDAMREVLDLEYVPSRLMDEPVLLTAPPPDLTRCDDFAGTAQSWTRRVMEWLTKYTLTPANIRYFQGTGQGHLFPGLVKLMRKQTSVLGDLDLDEGPGAEPVHRQLAKAIKANHVKVLDLYVCRHSPDYTTPTTQRASTHAAREHTQRASTHTHARTSTHAAHEHVRRALHSPAHVALVPPPCRACLTPHAPAHAHAHALLPLRLPCRFREWDTSGDGVISKQEFLRAMKQLSYDVPFYDYPAHSARAYHWRTRRDGGRAGDRAMYPQVVPAEMHDNPAGESEVTTVIMLMHDIVRVRQPRGRRRARSEI